MSRKVKKIFLTGYRATGKTSVAKELARMLGCAAVDSDRMIEERAGKSIAEMVEKEGWDAFRALEAEVLKELLEDQKPLVAALGGGAVLHEELMDQAMKSCFVVLLTAPIEVICRRMAKDRKTGSTRPSLTGQDIYHEVVSVLEERGPLYRRFSHLEVETEGRSPHQIADEIRQEFQYVR